MVIRFIKAGLRLMPESCSLIHSFFIIIFAIVPALPSRFLQRDRPAGKKVAGYSFTVNPV